MTYQLIGTYAILSDREGTPLRDRLTLVFPTGGVLVLNGNVHHSEKGKFILPRAAFERENTLRFHTTDGTYLCEGLLLGEDGRLTPAGIDPARAILALLGMQKELQGGQTALREALSAHEDRYHTADLFGR